MIASRTRSRSSWQPYRGAAPRYGCPSCGARQTRWGQCREHMMQCCPAQLSDTKGLQQRCMLGRDGCVVPTLELVRLPLMGKPSSHGRATARSAADAFSDRPDATATSGGADATGGGRERSGGGVKGADEQDEQDEVEVAEEIPLQDAIAERIRLADSNGLCIDLTKDDDDDIISISSSSLISSQDADKDDGGVDYTSTASHLSAREELSQNAAQLDSGGSGLDRLFSLLRLTRQEMDQLQTIAAERSGTCNATTSENLQICLSNVREMVRLLQTRVDANSDEVLRSADAVRQIESLNQRTNLLQRHIDITGNSILRGTTSNGGNKRKKQPHRQAKAKKMRKSSYNCPECSESFVKETHMLRHCLSEHGSAEAKFGCPTCGDRQPLWDLCLDHMRQCCPVRLLKLKGLQKKCRLGGRHCQVPARQALLQPAENASIADGQRNPVLQDASNTVGTDGCPIGMETSQRRGISNLPAWMTNVASVKSVNEGAKSDASHTGVRAAENEAISVADSVAAMKGGSAATNENSKSVASFGREHAVTRDSSQPRVVSKLLSLTARGSPGRVEATPAVARINTPINSVAVNDNYEQTVTASGRENTSASKGVVIETSQRRDISNLPTRMTSGPAGTESAAVAQTFARDHTRTMNDMSTAANSGTGTVEETSKRRGISNLPAWMTARNARTEDVQATATAGSIPIATVASSPSRRRWGNPNTPVAPVVPAPEVLSSATLSEQQWMLNNKPAGLPPANASVTTLVSHYSNSYHHWKAMEATQRALSVSMQSGSIRQAEAERLAGWASYCADHCSRYAHHFNSQN